jgi:hypothetical protein
VNVTDLAWAAGFLDCEGHFGIHRVSQGRRKSLRLDGTPFQRQVGFMQVVDAANRNPEPLEHLRELFGGRITTRQIKTTVYYQWRINAREQVGTVIGLLLPFLIAKRACAAHVLGFVQWSATTAPRQAMPAERRQQAEWFYHESRRLVSVHRVPSQGRPLASPTYVEGLRLAAGCERGQ